MQIREQGKKIQFIRTTYQPGLKRSTGKVVVTCPTFATELSPEDAARLTPQELEQVAAFFEKREAQQTAWRRQYSVQTLPSSIDLVVQHLQAGETLQAREAEAIWKGIAALQKALRKAGHPRPGRSSQAVS